MDELYETKIPNARWIAYDIPGNVGLYFSVEDEKELLAWSEHFTSVTRKGYMTGYRALDKRYGILANTIFYFGDKSKMCQMIEIQFKA